MQISISSLAEGIQQQQSLSAGTAVWNRAGGSTTANTVSSRQTPDSYSSEALRQLIAGYAPTMGQPSTGPQSPAVNLGSLRADSLQQLAHQVLSRLMHLTVGNGAVLSSSLSLSSAAGDASSGTSTSGATQSRNSQELATDSSTVGALTMKGTITADNGSVYDFSLAVQVGQETATDTQLSNSGGNSSLGSVSASALVMQSQISLSYAGSVQGTNDAQGQGGNTSQVADALQGLQDVAAAFASTVLGNGQDGGTPTGGIQSAGTQTASNVVQGLTSDGGAATPQSASEEPDNVPFTGSFSLSPKRSGNSGLEALFNDLNKLLSAQTAAARTLDISG